MSERRRGISLPQLSILSFDPTVDAADKKKGAPDEAGRPKDNDMLSHSTVSRVPQSIADRVTVFDDKEIKRRDAEMARMVAWLGERMARAKKEVFSEVVAITPILAGLLLQRNPDNRTISKKRLTEIRADLESGKWVFNGETIIVSSEGMLNDGQHRLTACRDSGVTLRALVVFGVSRSARLTTDQGTARTAADYLGMGGHKDATVVTAAVGRLLWQFEKYGTVDPRQREKRQATKAEITGTVADYADEISRSIEHAGKGHKLLGSQSLVAFCHLIFSRIDAVAASNFIGRAIDGTNLSATDPIYALRVRFMNDERLTTRDRFEAIARAWNAYRGNKPLTKIQIMGRVPKIEG